MLQIHGNHDFGHYQDFLERYRSQKYQNHIYHPYLLPASFRFLLPLAKLSSNASFCPLAAVSSCFKLCLPGAIARTGCTGAASAVWRRILFAAYSLSISKLSTVGCAVDDVPVRPRSWRFAERDKFRSVASAARELTTTGCGFMAASVGDPGCRWGFDLHRRMDQD